jgi:hypothetical protein
MLKKYNFSQKLEQFSLNIILQGEWRSKIKYTLKKYLFYLIMHIIQHIGTSRRIPTCLTVLHLIFMIVFSFYLSLFGKSSAAFF